MGLAAERHTMTLDEFLAWESTQAERWEFLGGETFMMAGGSDVHNAISLNAAFSLIAAFHGKPCNVFMSDASRWTLTEASGADTTLALPALGIELVLAELYRDLLDAPANPQATAPAA